MKNLLRWFSSAKFRQAADLHKIVLKHLHAQRDILGAEALRELDKAVATMQAALDGDTNNAALESRMAELEAVANKWLKPYPNASYRENVEVILVAIAVAMAIRTFFLQPFKIPTGSMQPTLYGITDENLKLKPDYKRPAGLEAFKAWFRGDSFIEVVADHDCELDRIDDPVFIFYQVMHFKDGTKKIIWFPPDYGQNTLWGRAGIGFETKFKAGDKIVDLVVHGGDRLFVDRLTYNFRPPKRGEIIVFETRGIDGLPQDQYFIKRMVGMGGEELRIKDDRHLEVNGKELDASVPHFENVYSFNPSLPPREHVYGEIRYDGHVNQTLAGLATPPRYLAPLFQDERVTYSVRPKHYVVMGDNTMNSLDSRTWGDFKQESVMGRYWMVYWPFTDRFGWGAR